MATTNIKRRYDKITLEEAVGSPYFDAMRTTPSIPMVTGLKGNPFSQEFVEQVSGRLFDVPARLKAMDDGGISYQIVSLTSPGIEGILNADEAVELARKTNDHIYETYVRAYPERFGWICSVPLQQPVEAAKELERCVTQLGALGVLINGFTNMSAEDINEIQYLDEPQCDPFWAMLSKLDVPLYLHPRLPPPSQQRLYKGYPNLAQAAYGFGVETGGHALRIMCSGVLDRYPNVQIILGHCAEALPFLIHRVDHRMAIGVPGSNGAHKKSMMEYLQTNFYATLSGVRRESTLRNTIDELGQDRVLYSIDYPYESTQEAANWFDGLPLSENTRQAIAFGNSRGLFKLK